MKKMLVAGIAAVVAASCLFVSCGEDKKPASTASSSNSSAPAAEGKVLRICAWNEEFQSRVKDFYPGYNKDTDMIGDVKVEWIITPSNDNAYQNKLDTDLAAQSSAKADDKIDLFLVESDYALKYTDTAYAMDVKDLGITDADIADQYKYTKDIMTSSDGKLKGLSWQACPAGYVYRRSYAKDVLGTDDPDEVQKALSDWAKFDEVAAKAKAKGYNMVSGYDDDFRVFSDNVKTPWVVNGKIVIDDSIKEWVKQTKLYTEKGYNQKTSLWASEWTQGMMKDGKVFGYFGPAWFVDFCMPHNEEGAAFGDWAFCKGPQGFSWGGTWICAATGTDNPTLVKDIMLKLTCNPEIMTSIAKIAGDFANNKKAMEAVANSDYKNEFLGGQNHMAFFLASAESCDKSKISSYDQGMCEKFQAAMHEYFDNKVTEEEAYKNFYDTILQVYPDLSK